MKYCPYCGIQLEDSMIFCRKCGRKYPEDDQSDCAGAAVEGEIGAEEGTGADPVPDEAPVFTIRPPVQKKKQTGLVIVIAACAVVILAVLIVMTAMMLDEGIGSNFESRPSIAVSKGEVPGEPGGTARLSEAPASFLYLEMDGLPPFGRGCAC